ncbi:MAG: glycosyltransferase [Ignavibacteria bacterium]|nr:glycosyltransferase [Ignavibacteria bacterium]
MNSPGSEFPRITIITPCLNGGRYIAQALASVRRQNYPAVEHLVIDGGSSDDTSAIVRQFSHATFISERDGGQTEAINKGLRRASGEIIGWLNSDDSYQPGALHAIARRFRECPDADLVYGAMQFVDRDGHFIRPVPNTPFDKNMLFYYGCYIPSTATFWHRRIIDDGHRLDESFRVAMDWEWFLRLAVLGYRFHFLNRTLASFTRREDSVSATNASLEREERERIWQMYRDHFRTARIGTVHRSLIWYWFRLKRVLLKATQGSE